MVLTKGRKALRPYNFNSVNRRGDPPGRPSVCHSCLEQESIGALQETYKSPDSATEPIYFLGRTGFNNMTNRSILQKARRDLREASYSQTLYSKDDARCIIAMPSVE